MTEYPPTKTCRVCHQDKPLDDFYPNRRNKYGRQYQCKECQKNAVRLYLYGVTFEQFAQMMQEQDGKCAICQTSDQSLCVDHIHNETKQIRGLLCRKCNRALGAFRDSPTLLSRAAAYLLEKGHV